MIESKVITLDHDNGFRCVQTYNLVDGTEHLESVPRTFSMRVI